MDKSSEEAIGRLVPFAQAVLALKDLGEEERRINRSIAAAQERLDAIIVQANDYAAKSIQAKSALASTQAELERLRADITKGQEQAKALVEKSKLDAGEAYQTEYNSRAARIAELDVQLSAKHNELIDLEAQTRTAAEGLAAVRADIAALQHRLA